MTKPRLAEAMPLYAKIGLLSFGGPTAQIALMQEEIVSRRGWVAQDEFQRGLSVSMVLPGPEAQQLASYLGWRLHGIPGGIAAGLAFVLPGAVLMVALAWLAAARGEAPLVAALFYGIQPAVLVLVARALAGLARRALSGRADIALAAGAFAALWLAGLPFPAVVAAAALAGLAIPRGTGGSAGPAPPAWRFATVFGAGMALTGTVWALARQARHLPVDAVAGLFTSAAFVSFGGAYALLPYVASHAVETHGWLSAEQMLNGLALAEATPGPLILVNTYAGFFAGWPGDGVATAALATFFTFAPSFTLILAGAPYVEALAGHRWIRRALAGVSAAVVGVILNLALYLGMAALFPQGLAAPEWPKIALLVGFAGLALAWRGVPMQVLVGGGAAAGLGLHALGLIA